MTLGARMPRQTGIAQQLAVAGFSMAVDITGDGPAVLFVHGFPLDRSMWRAVAGTLTGWRRIAPDLRGLGLSEGRDGPYTMAGYADDLAALLDTLHVERAIVCGLSMGGYVAFEILRRHAERVRGLILVNTRATADDPSAGAARDAMIARVRREGTGFLADDMLPKLLAPSSIQTMPDVVRHVREMVTHSPAQGVIGALTAMRDRPDSTATLGAIPIRTLVVAGSDDRMIPVAAARSMAAAIPDAQFAVIPAAGHLAPVEQPVNTGRMIRGFLEAFL
jgi:3-oxoadipate enol-lactonase